ncbi:MAG: DCC1-like thiol-disulfide oxidoreductase family protein [Proteobacteria bacterium]|nr:DCC1-like thiol-disulfide oxidoreductase family protein [Pseudomonadota bacterium]
MTADDKKSGVVIFDGVCNLCNGAVDFIIRRDPEARFLFTPTQGELARQLARRHNIQESLDETFVLIQANKCYYRTDAALEIASQLTGGWRLLQILRVIPAGLRDWVYGIVAGHRYDWFGRRDVCMTPTDDVSRRFVN